MFPPALQASQASIPFLLHLIIELPAAIQFTVSPSATLRIRQPHAHALIRQYALLLMASNLIAAAFVLHDRRHSECSALERAVAAALAIYHLGPLLRAMARYQNGEGENRGLVMQPWLHLIVHFICGLELAGRGFLIW